MAVLAFLVAGCGPLTDPATPPPPPSSLTGAGPFIVSNPVTTHAPGSAPGGTSAAGSVTYVSLPPGTLPGGTRVTIRVERTGAVVSAELLDGGLDPVAIPAVSGDTISLAVQRIDGTASVFRFTLAIRKPPIIVRTRPEKNKRDVPLNVRLQVVFSEPIDPASLTPQHFELRSGSDPIAGQLRFANGEHTIVEFIPTTDLAAATDYELVVDLGVRDSDGTPLEAGARIPFATAPATPPPTGPSLWVISNPVQRPGAAPVAFVSLAPGTLPDYGLVRIYNLNRAISVDGSFGILVDGGLDPVAVLAEAGDQLSMTIYRTASGQDGALWLNVTPPVPASTSPVIIRTNPKHQQQGVWLNERPQVVLSEPIDPASLTPQVLELRSGGSAIAGQLGFANSEHTVVEFTPAADLEPATDYQLVLRQGIHDLEGTPLQAEASISFTTAPRTPAPAGPALAFVRDDQIHLVNPDGTGLVQLTHTGTGVWNRDPAWSPDGQRLAFTSNRDRGPSDPVFGARGDIYVMNSDGSNVLRRTGAGYNGEPAWSPDGRVIAYSSVQNGNDGVSVIDPDGGEPRVLFDRQGITVNPAWSPDGQTITITSDWRAFDFVFDLYAMNADGSNARTVLEGPFYWNELQMRFYFQSAWSTDGKTIAVVVCSWGLYGCFPKSAIAVMNPDGSGLRVIAETGGYARPTWSPDGQAIAFGTSRCFSCPSSIRFVRLDGTGGGFITNGHSPAWRP